jgi:LysR family hydrogen peroxide-inducible transcriptional activator
MTFQQLEYIVAVDKYRHFVNAATACGVTQSTLSSMIQRLEQEIDVIIFDRKKHPIEPTALGKQIISQARLILHTSSQLRELVLSEKEQEHGTLYIGMPPSVTPYIYPTFHRLISAEHPGIRTGIFECSSERLLQMLQQGEIDMAISAQPGGEVPGLLEIELYTERFLLYISSAHALYQRERVNAEDLMDGDLWVLRSFHECYPQLGDLIHHDTRHRTSFEVGSLSTLVSLIDENGGYTILPQLYAQRLTPEQQRNLRPINGAKFFRPVSLIIRSDYVREHMLNIVADLIKRIVPSEMINPRLKKFKITL